ncbi:MAG: hypothetical protein JO173_00165 [Gammaproteobacteria bacterium]|nr:hypothetical protein [Gammaproteobacteria bacterium]
MRIPSLVAVAALSAASSLNPTIVKGEEPDALCPRGNATLHGEYFSMGGGTVPGVGPVAFIGRIHFDGKGNLTNPFTVSLGGTIRRAVAPGSYTVNDDCSGTFLLETPIGPHHYDLRVMPDGSKVDYIETDSGTIISGGASRMRLDE